MSFTSSCMSLASCSHVDSWGPRVLHTHLVDEHSKCDRGVGGSVGNGVVEGLVGLQPRDEDAP